MSMRIVVDDDELKRVRQQLGELQHKAPNVISRALNRSLTNINTTIRKGVRTKYTVQATDVKDRLDSVRASPSKLAAKVTAKGRPIGLDKFKVSPKTVNPRRKKQLKISVKKGSAKEILGAFIGNQGNEKVFIRDGKPRLPISRLFGPSVPQMIGNNEVVEQINQSAYETYHKNINYEINYLLGKMGAK